MFAWILILIIFVSILKLSYVGPHRLAWWKVRIGDGLRIPDTRRIPRDSIPTKPHRCAPHTTHAGVFIFQIPQEYLGITFPPSHTVVHLIHRLVSLQGCLFSRYLENTLGYIPTKPHHHAPHTTTDFHAGVNILLDPGKYLGIHSHQATQGVYFPGSRKYIVIKQDWFWFSYVKFTHRIYAFHWS